MSTTNFESLSAAIKNIRELLPKEDVTSQYARMIQLAMDFAAAEVNDEILNRENKEMEIDQEEMCELLHQKYEFHVKNQMELFKLSKKVA